MPAGPELPRRTLRKRCRRGQIRSHSRIPLSHARAGDASSCPACGTTFRTWGRRTARTWSRHPNNRRLHLRSHLQRLQVQKSLDLDPNSEWKAGTAMFIFDVLPHQIRIPEHFTALLALERAVPAVHASVRRQSFLPGEADAAVLANKRFLRIGNRETRLGERVILLR